MKAFKLDLIILDLVMISCEFVISDYVENGDIIRDISMYVHMYFVILDSDGIL